MKKRRSLKWAKELRAFRDYCLKCEDEASIIRQIRIRIGQVSNSVTTRERAFTSYATVITETSSYSGSGSTTIEALRDIVIQMYNRNRNYLLTQKQ